MTAVGAPGDRLCRCPCYCTPGPLAQRLRDAAAEYASTLVDGSKIHGDVGGMDAETIAPFAAYLPEALIAAGFSIHTRLEEGRVVTIVRRKS